MSAPTDSLNMKGLPVLLEYEILDLVLKLATVQYCGTLCYIIATHILQSETLSSF